MFCANEAPFEGRDLTKAYSEVENLAKSKFMTLENFPVKSKHLNNFWKVSDRHKVAADRLYGSAIGKSKDDVISIYRATPSGRVRIVSHHTIT